jgi:hypothetical protein
METLGIHQGQCYAKSSVGVAQPWMRAQSTCLGAGGTLPVHVNVDMQKFLETQLLHRSDMNEYWIGLMTVTNAWKWVSHKYRNDVQSICAGGRNDAQFDAIYVGRFADTLGRSTGGGNVTTTRLAMGAVRRQHGQGVAVSIR